MRIVVWGNGIVESRMLWQRGESTLEAHHLAERAARSDPPSEVGGEHEAEAEPTVLVMLRMGRHPGPGCDERHELRAATAKCEPAHPQPRHDHDGDRGEG